MSETDHLGFSLSARKRKREIRAAEKTRARAIERGLGFLCRTRQREESGGKDESVRLHLITVNIFVCNSTYQMYRI
jgi:hypothetical protein